MLGQGRQPLKVEARERLDVSLLLAAAAAELVDRAECFRAAGLGAETAAKVLHEVQPGIGTAVEAGEDGFEVVSCRNSFGSADAR